MAGPEKYMAKQLFLHVVSIHLWYNTYTFVLHALSIKLLTASKDNVLNTSLMITA